MKNQIVRYWLLGLVSFGLAVLPLKAATYIYGDISFIGGVTLNGPLESATAFTSFFGPFGPGNGPMVSYGATGTYAGVAPGTEATFNPFSFNPEPAGAFTLWSFTDGLTTYSFEVTSLVVNTQNGNFLNIQGQGIAYATGYDPTPGTWSITDTGTGNSPVFTFGNVTAVPEPSTSLLLFGGCGVMLLRAFRRK